MCGVSFSAGTAYWRTTRIRRAAVAYNTVLAWVVAWAVYRLFMWL